MTTIAFDPTYRQLIADSMSVAGTTVYTTSMTKLEEVTHPVLGRCIFGAAGNADYRYAAMEAISQAAKLQPDFPPVMQGTDLEIFLLTEAGVLYECHTPAMILYPSPDQEAFNAIGSGTAVAFGAYRACGSITQTMQVVRELDIYTGGSLVSARWVPARDGDGTVAEFVELD